MTNTPRTLHLLYTGRRSGSINRAFPTRAAAEAEIVRLVLTDEADAFTDGAEIIEVHVGDEPGEQAAAALVDLWRGVTPERRDAVGAECGGLVALLDALRDARPVVEPSAEQLDALRARLTS